MIENQQPSGPEDEAGTDEAEKKAMEQAQEDAAEERENEGGYQ